MSDPIAPRPDPRSPADAQIRALAPAWSAIAALALLVSAILLQIAALISALDLDGDLFDDAWKERLWVLASPSLVIGLMLVVGVALAGMAPAGSAQHRTLKTSVGPLVLLVAAVVAVIVALAALADLTELGDDFAGSLEQLLSRLAALVLLLAAAAGAWMARARQVA